MSEETKLPGIFYGISTNTKTIKKKLEDIVKENDLRHKELLQRLQNIETYLGKKTQGDI